MKKKLCMALSVMCSVLVTNSYQVSAYTGVPTGDETSTTPYIILLVVAIVAIVALFVIKKKKK